MEGYRKLVVAGVTILIQAALIWFGRTELTVDVTSNVVSVVNAIFNLIILFSPTVGAGLFMHYNVKSKQVK